MYSFNKFFIKIAEKYDIPPKLCWNLNSNEIESLLLNKLDLSKISLNKRNNCMIEYSIKGETFFYDKDAEKLINSLVLEDININSKLKGMPVCPGFVKGTVKIIEKIEDIYKMKEGDILVSHITYPTLVPAMKKASAIITNVGGFICHAAIIARELGIPCVVGTKYATKVLHDGDLVEVDADKGIIKILK